jgi:flagellar basal-body rod modification protein FlgD
MIDQVGQGFDFSTIGAAPQKKTADEGALGQEQFLSLMITQLKNQDPFKPMESGEFLGQLAQFGTVSGLGELQSSFNGLATSLVSGQALQAAGLVGRSALAESNIAPLTKGGSVDAAVDVPASTGGVHVEVRDAAGAIVRHIELGAQPTGLARFVWDGTTDTGAEAPTGKYRISATYASAEGKSTAADTFVAAQVDSVMFGADGFTVELRGIGEMPFSAVREIRNPVPVDGTDPN